METARIIALLCALIGVTASALVPSIRSLADEALLHKSTPRPVDDGDLLELLDPPIVPDPANPGERWWYTPSRKAHLYSNRFKSAIRHQKNVMSGKMGEEMRLPGDVSPSFYFIRLFPFVELIPSGNYTTDGYVEITFTCVKGTRNISFNAAELDIDKATVKLVDVKDNAEITILNHYDEQNTREIYTLEVPNYLVEGTEYKLSMEFTSIMNGDLRGFYRSSYIEDDGTRKWLAVTQMEATDARRAFPSFDEPSMKANFSIILGRNQNMTAVSNMKQTKTEPIIGMPGYVWDYFATSVRMSTYLVAALVSEFTNKAADPSLSNVQFRIWARPNAMHLTDYAIDIGPRILEFFESYYGINYPLSKQDMAAIPDFAAGAMENFGLITYREQDLLIDLETTTARLKQRVAIVSAHELAHQWFGDLVTMDWWNAIWLNEGFASYMEFIGTDSVEPDFLMEEQFVVENLQYVFGPDSLETSRPINLEVNTPEEINRLFDVISYEKGSCIIRMCADFLGVSTFQKGLNNYLTKNAYGNAQQDDLWQALQEKADEDQVKLPASVKEIMDTWTYKMGYPVVYVSRDYAAKNALVIQNRFLLRQTQNNASRDDIVYTWWIPLSYTSAAHEAGQRSSEWMSDKEQALTLDLPMAGRNDWVIFNVDQQNYYRVAYDEGNYALIKAQLLADHARISANNRAQLLDDTFVLASVEIVPYKVALDLTMYLKNETEYVPWNAVSSELDYIDIMLHNEAQYPDWKKYVSTLVQPYYDSLGFNESKTDAHLKIYSRTDATYWACKLGVSDCVSEAQLHYSALMTNPDMMLPPNQKQNILNTAVANGKKAEWDFAFEMYKSKNDLAYLDAMTKSRDPSTLYSLLEKMLDANSGIKQSHITRLFSGVASNPLGTKIAMDFLIYRWNDIEKSLGKAYFSSFYRSICNWINKQEDLDKMIKLRDDHASILGSSANVQQGIEVAQQNVKWLTLNKMEIGSWLTGLSTESPPSTEPTTEMTTEHMSSTIGSTTTTSATEEPTTVPSVGNSFYASIINSLLIICTVYLLY